MITDFLLYSYHLCSWTQHSKCPSVLGFSFPFAVPALLHQIKTNRTPLWDCLILKLRILNLSKGLFVFMLPYFKIYLLILPSFFLILFWLYFTLQYCIGFAIHWHESAKGVYEFPVMNPPPMSHPISSLWIIPVHQPQASCRTFGLWGRGRGWDDLGEWHWNMYTIM